MWARRIGGARVAAMQLACSGACALPRRGCCTRRCWPWALWLLLWGMTVSGDSPQFSALTASNAPRALVGSVLTLVNSIGFAISTATIVLFVHLASVWPLHAGAAVAGRGAGDRRVVPAAAVAMSDSHRPRVGAHAAAAGAAHRYQHAGDGLVLPAVPALQSDLASV